jgi:hypothetical protein
MPSEASAAAGVVRRTTRDGAVSFSVVATTEIGFSLPRRRSVSRGVVDPLTQRPAGG